MNDGYPFEHYVEGGHQHVRRARPVCDFCLVPWEDAWTYPAVEMPIVGHALINASNDDWAVCDECHRLLQGSRIGELVERIVTMQPIHEPPNEWRRYRPTPIARRVARENVLRFLDARKAPPYRGHPDGG